MSDFRVKIIDDRGRFEGGVSVNSTCVYCGSPAVSYVWCRRCYTDIALAKRGVVKYAMSKDPQ